MNAMDERSIVVICNGPSISNIDWRQLDEFNTFGINGSFKLWNDIDWYPTYQYIGRKHEKQWSEGIQTFLNRNTCKKIFYNRYVYSEFSSYGEIMQPLTFRDYPDINPDPEKYENPFMHDVNVALAMIVKTNGVDFAQKIVDALPDDIDNKLNVYGIYKTLMGETENIRDCDYVKKDRYVVELMPPKSFDEFYFSGGMSGAAACLISYLLGYNKIVLIGCDNNFIINNEKMDTEKSYGIPDMFYGHEYDTNEDIPCPVCRTTDGLRKAMTDWWYHLAKMIDYSDMDLKIINCSPEDNIDGAFLHVDPEVVFGKNIYKDKTS